MAVTITWNPGFIVRANGTEVYRSGTWYVDGAERGTVEQPCTTAEQPKLSEEFIIQSLEAQLITP